MIYPSHRRYATDRSHGCIRLVVLPIPLQCLLPSLISSLLYSLPSHLTHNRHVRCFDNLDQRVPPSFCT